MNQLLNTCTIFVLALTANMALAEGIEYPLHTGGGGNCPPAIEPILSGLFPVNKAELQNWDVTRDSRCDQVSDGCYPCRVEFRSPSTGVCSNFTATGGHGRVRSDVIVVLACQHGGVLRRSVKSHIFCDDGYFLQQNGRENASCVAGTCPAGTERDEYGNCLAKPRFADSEFRKNSPGC